jgi:DNA-binding IclR family transcriptional regulator
MKVKSADRTILIIEAIAEKKEGLSHGDISQFLNIPKSSLTSLLSTLVDRDYVVFDKATRHYLLGPQLLRLAGRYLERMALVQLGRPIVREITGSTDESAEIAIRSGPDIVIVCKEDCTRPLKMVIQIGDRAPLYATAAGKAILANLSDDEQEEYLYSARLKEITAKTTIDIDKLRRELKIIQSGAIAYSREEFNEGIIAMATPILAPGNRVAGSIVVPVPALRFSPQKEAAIEKALRQGAAALSDRLGYDRTNP